MRQCTSHYARRATREERRHATPVAGTAPRPLRPRPPHGRNIMARLLPCVNARVTMSRATRRGKHATTSHAPATGHFGQVHLGRGTVHATLRRKHGATATAASAAQHNTSLREHRTGHHDDDTPRGRHMTLRHTPATGHFGQVHFGRSAARATLRHEHGATATAAGAAQHNTSLRKHRTGHHGKAKPRGMHMTLRHAKPGRHIDTNTSTPAERHEQSEANPTQATRGRRAASPALRGQLLPHRPSRNVGTHDGRA